VAGEVVLAVEAGLVGPEDGDGRVGVLLDPLEGGPQLGQEGRRRYLRHRDINKINQDNIQVKVICNAEPKCTFVNQLRRFDGFFSLDGRTLKKIINSFGLIPANSKAMGNKINLGLKRNRILNSIYI